MSWAKVLVGAVVAGVVAAVAPEVIELIKDKIDDLGESDIVSIWFPLFSFCEKLNLRRIYGFYGKWY